MANQIDVSANIEAMERLRRNPEQLKDVSSVSCGGGGTSVWVVKVKSHLAYNVYNVGAVRIGQAGSEPVEIGQQVEAINAGESFEQQVGAAVGKYAVMFKVGQKRIFYCQV